MLKKITLQNREIEYTLQKSARSRRLRVSVYCDASVAVTAPVFLAEHKIEKFLKEKSSWVLGKIDKFLSLGAIPRPRRNHREYIKYRAQARDFTRAKIDKINKIYQFSFGKITIKNSRTRWGSCSKTGNLNFNYKIIFLPEPLAEYIVAHELCHLQEFNHSSNFWKLVSRFAPDYKQIKARLKKHIF